MNVTDKLNGKYVLLEPKSLAQWILKNDENGFCKTTFASGRYLCKHAK